MVRLPAPRLQALKFLIVNVADVDDSVVVVVEDYDKGLNDDDLPSASSLSSVPNSMSTIRTRPRLSARRVRGRCLSLWDSHPGLTWKPQTPTD